MSEEVKLYISQIHLHVIKYGETMWYWNSCLRLKIPSYHSFHLTNSQYYSICYSQVITNLGTDQNRRCFTRTGIEFERDGAISQFPKYKENKDMITYVLEKDDKNKFR